MRTRVSAAMALLTSALLFGVATQAQQTPPAASPPQQGQQRGGNTDDVLHWTAWNIPGTTNEIPEGKLPEGSVIGKNMRDNNYMGPGAPPGPRYHHYVFEFYALNAKLDLPASAGRAELLAAMKGKVIAKAAYVGRFRATAAASGAPAGPPPGAAR